MSKSLKRFRIRKYGMIFLFIFLMCGNITTLAESFQGEIYAHINGILCLVRFLLYGQLLLSRVSGKGPYKKLLLVMIVLEIASFAPQLLLDYEILNLSQPIFYYLLLDAYSQGLLLFLLIDEYVYIQSLEEDISAYQAILNDNHNEALRR